MNGEWSDTDYRLLEKQNESPKDPNRAGMFKVHASFLQPWSTFVMSTTLPPPILEAMIKLSDEVMTDPERKNHGEYLEGQIDDEIIIPPNKLNEKKILIPFFLNVLKQYIIHASIQSQPDNVEILATQEWLPKLNRMWIVSQKDNEYNPLHEHLNCLISAVMYLKIPEYLPSRKSHRPKQDGSILFTNNTSQDKFWSNATLQIIPEVGDFFIFPATQQHMVYPFRTEDGKGERVSVSFNATFANQTDQTLVNDGRFKLGSWKPGLIDRE